MKSLLKLTLVLFLLVSSMQKVLAQNIIIQQNNGKPEEKVVTKEVLVEKPVYIEKTPSKPTSPVCILGYLYVFPDIFFGDVNDLKELIKELNANNAHGFSDWRLPTMAELRILYSQKNMLPEIMDDNHGYISSEFIRIYNHYGLANYPLHKKFDPSGKHWQVERGAGITGTAIIVRQ